MGGRGQGEIERVRGRTGREIRNFRVEKRKIERVKRGRQER